MMDLSSSTTLTELVDVPEPRKRFLDNNAPVVFSFKRGAEEAEYTLRRLVGWPGEWIGYDVDTPDAGSIVRAEDVLSRLRRAASTANNWQEPHVSAGQDGDIVMEWWADSRKITLYVSAADVECLRVRGPDVDDDMDESVLTTDGDFQALWAWLNNA